MKRFVVLTLLALITISSNFTSLTAKELSNINNNLIKNSIGNIVCSEYIDCTDEIKIKMHKEKLYDYSINEIGYVYNFEVKKSDYEGFAIIIEDGDSFVVEEIHITQADPYNMKKGKNIYTGYMSYYELYQGNLFDVINNTYTTYHPVEGVEESMYMEDGIPEPDEFVPVTYSYYYREIATGGYNTLPNGFPLYTTSMSNVGNNCAQTAAMEILSYYDLMYPGLLYFVNTSLSQDGDYKNYSELTTDEQGRLEDVHDALATVMNNTGDGTLNSDFYYGLKSYVNYAGYSMDSVNIINSPSFFDIELDGDSLSNYNHYEEYKDLIDQGIPVAMHLGGGLLNNTWYTMIYDPEIGEDINVSFELITIDGHMYDYITLEEIYTTSGGRHTVVGYGYIEYDYYELYVDPDYSQYPEEVLGKTDRFAIIANGWYDSSFSSEGYSYLNVEDPYSITYAYGIDIFTETPDVELSTIRSYVDAIRFQTNIDDPNDTIIYGSSSVKLYRGFTLVDQTALPSDGVYKTFYGLDDYTLYKLEVTVTYNLNDGTGNHTTITYTTYVRTQVARDIGIMF